MQNRLQMVAGNWKMNMDYEQGRELALGVVDKLQPSDRLVVLCTPYIHLQNVSNISKDISNLRLGAQNCHEEEAGAYTGEVSAAMLRSVGVEFVILGHSERRQYFAESDALIAKKITKVLEQKMRPIFCCGEPLEVREQEKQESYVATQLRESLFGLNAKELERIVIAYEPIWAIGTGKTATPQQVQDMHAFIRKQIATQYSEELAERISILYGGSVKPKNAAELFANTDVDGGLIGGASLKADDFIQIVEAL